MSVEQRFLNRELSWIAFNRRVLEEAQDRRNPLLERAKFLAIVSSNLDEFCMVRLAGLHRERHQTAPDPAGLTPVQQLEQVRSAVDGLVADQYRCWREEVEPALLEEGCRLVGAEEWDAPSRTSLQSYFHDNVAPVLTPLAVDPGRPFPLLAGLTIHIAVRLQPPPEDPRKGPLYAVVAVPKGQRLIGLPGTGRYALLEDVVAHFLDEIFPGYSIRQRATFRVTRDGDLDIDEDEATDLLVEIEEELRNRGHGNPVRLELAPGIAPDLVEWLRLSLELESEDVCELDGPLDLTLLFGIGRDLTGSHLSFPDFVANTAACDWEDPFAELRRRDILLHHPYDSFQPIVEFVEHAADDPAVLAIKQTLYRVSGESPIVRALIRAARAGKQVTVLVELKARFDEEANIRWARRLEEAGAHVIYGLLGYKVHAKLLLIIRRDEDGINRYCHLGTGNYNDKTARLYTDLSYLTCNEAVGRDVAALFNMLTGFAQPPDWEKLLVAPTTMRSGFYELIRREADCARQGRGGRIIAKFNSLVDAPMCEELYRASQAGVEIDLLVRGICILRPGVPVLSENIRVRSVVGRFLEHSRIFFFAQAGEPVYLMGSADWMGRNLDRRVEHMVRIDEPELQQAITHLLDLYLADDSSVRLQQPDGSYRRLRSEAPGVQQRLMAEAEERRRRGESPTGQVHRRRMTPMRKPRKR